MFSLFTFQSGEVIHNVRQKNFTLLSLTGQIELTPVIMREINISKLESRRKKTLRNLKSVQNNGRVFRLELRTLTIEIQKKAITTNQQPNLCHYHNICFIDLFLENICKTLTCRSLKYHRCRSIYFIERVVNQFFFNITWLSYHNWFINMT